MFPNIEVHFPLVLGNFVNVKNYHNLHSILLEDDKQSLYYLLGKKLVIDIDAASFYLYALKLN